MNDKKRLSSYDDLPLVLDVADIQYTPPASQRSAGADLSRSARLLFLNGWQKAPRPYRKATNKWKVSFPICNTAAFPKGAYRGKKP